MGDVIEPLGVSFINPLPLLLFHDSTQPVGQVRFKTPTRQGIDFDAFIPEVSEPGLVKDSTDKAAHLVKYGLIRGMSIGFRPIDDAVEPLKTGGLRFVKSEVVELSMVPIPAQIEAQIHVVKSIDAAHLAATGNGEGLTTPGVSGTPAGKPARATMKTYQEQIQSLEATRQAKSAELEAIQTKVSGEGRTKDAAERESFDTLKKEIEDLDAELKDARDMEALNRQALKPVAPQPDLQKASESRNPAQTYITVRDNRPPGIGFARKVMCQVVGKIDQRPPQDIAKERYPDDAGLVASFVKGAVPAGTTTETVWASPLVYPTNLESEFIDYLRPMTIIGKLSLHPVPFNVRFVSQTSGGTGYWVGQGQPKPLTSFAFGASTLGFTKVAAISVITEELARFSSPSAETLVRNALAAALIERLDIDFIDPTSAAVAGVQPASITNGLVALSSAGTSADNVRTDLGKIIGAFVAANMSTASLTLIMPNSLALVLSIMVNSLGQPEFPGLTVNGGTLNGIPVVTSQYAANSSGAGNLVIALAASEIFLADDGQVRVDASREASLQMLDNPTNNSATATATTMVSMYQTNSIALRAERFINWAKRRSDAVVYMDDVNWGSVGSPA
jgi:HK97 family phage major capsid protein/HK97 family phage prohead protease